MDALKKIFFILIVSGALFPSCTLEKRQYRNGYYFETHRPSISKNEVPPSANATPFTNRPLLISSPLEEIQRIEHKEIEKSINPIRENSVLVQLTKKATVTTPPNKINTKKPVDKKNIARKNNSKDDGGNHRKSGILMMILALALIALGYLFFVSLGVFGIILFLILGIGGAIFFIFGLIKVIIG